MPGNAIKSAARGSQLQTTERSRDPHASHRQCSISRTPNKSETTTRLSFPGKRGVLTANLPTCIHTRNAPNVCVETATQLMRSKTERPTTTATESGWLISPCETRPANVRKQASTMAGGRQERADQKPMHAPTQRLSTKCTDKWPSATDRDSL